MFKKGKTSEDRSCPHCGTERVVKTVVTECRCELTFLDVREDDIALRWDHGPCEIIASRDGLARLPPDLRHPEIVRNLVYASGSRGNGFRPELLHEGVWVLTHRRLVADRDRRIRHETGAFCDFAELKTVADAEALVRQKAMTWAMIFADGRFVKRLERVTVSETRTAGWPPEEDVKPDVTT